MEEPPQQDESHPSAHRASRASRAPNIDGLLTIVQRREEERVNVVARFENWEDEEDDGPKGKLMDSLEHASAQTWVSLTNFTKDEFMDLFREVDSESTSLPHRGRKPAVPNDDALLALLILYASAPKHWDLCAKVGYSETALRNALQRIRPLLDDVLRRRWWSDRQRPVPLEETHFPYIGLITDVNSIEVYRPGERFDEMKKYFDGKNRMYALKFEVAVSASPPHFALFTFRGRLGSTHDYTIHQRNYMEMRSYLQKLESEIPIIPEDRANRYWAILGDKAYEDREEGTPGERRMFIKRNPRTSAERSQNTELKRLRVPVECFFGRMWKLWSLLRKAYPYSHEQIDLDYENMLLLTNEHIRATHHLEEQDQTLYRAALEERKRRYDQKLQAREESRRRYLTGRKRRLQEVNWE